jgi:hypothetical protein
VGGGAEIQGYGLREEGGGSWPNGEWRRGERGWMGGRGRSNIGRRGVRATQHEEEDLNSGSPVARQMKEEEWVA